jgi:hypothetical protein
MRGVTLVGEFGGGKLPPRLPRLFHMLQSSALILDCWDGTTRWPAGDPFPLDIASVMEVEVP